MPSHNDPDQRHSARRGGVNVPKETGVAHVMLTRTNKYTHMHMISLSAYGRTPHVAVPDENVLIHSRSSH